MRFATGLLPEHFAVFVVITLLARDQDNLRVVVGGEILGLVVAIDRTQLSA